MRIPNLVGLCFVSASLAACGTNRPPTAPPLVLNVAMCQHVEAPPVEPLSLWTFKALPTDLAGKVGDIVAGVTAEDLRAILANHSTFKRREDKWQNRAKVTNDCLDKVNAPTPTTQPTVSDTKPQPKPKKRFGLF